MSDLQSPIPMEAPDKSTASASEQATAKAEPLTPPEAQPVENLPKPEPENQPPRENAQPVLLKPSREQGVDLVDLLDSLQPGSKVEVSPSTPKGWVRISRQEALRLLRERVLHRK